ncbi:MAG: hypothetical protein LBK18_05635 [Prevotellaceae bacterium]|jgi:hypothetical protein|nr:hypothetical protein [Prevotellaceae bacterium]
MKNQWKFAAALAALLAAEVCAAQAYSRGVKREKEECEELAFQAEANPRASASATSQSEAIAYRIAMTEARAELAAQLAAEITGFVRRRMEQYQMTASAGGSSQSASGILEADSSETVQRVSEILSNSRPICKNAYDRPDGSVQVYVCLEMGLPAQRQAYKRLKEDGLIDVDVDNDGKAEVDFDEKSFLLDLAKAREEYNAKKAEEE